jgi:Flp pilus assembly protein TadD
MEAARLNPRDIETHLALGAALAQMKRHRAALDAFRAALGVKLRCARAHYGVGICCLFIGDRAQAKRELAVLERLDRALAFKLRHYLHKHPAAPGDERGVTRP